MASPTTPLPVIEPLDQNDPLAKPYPPGESCSTCRSFYPTADPTLGFCNLYPPKLVREGHPGQFPLTRAAWFCWQWSS